MKRRGIQSGALPAELEADRRLRRAGRSYRAENEKVPPRVRALIDGTLQAGITRQHIAPGETLPELVSRVCPNVYTVALGQGYALDLDLPENTNRNLAAGKVFYVLRRVVLH